MTAADNADGVALRDAVLAAVAWAVVVAANVLVFLGMRAVMAVGGACADGGPYVSAQPCPDGVGAAMGLAFPVGAFAWIAAQYYGLRVGGIWAASLIVAWTALFASLGWNFWEAGLGPLTVGQGPDWGGIICGVVFWGLALGGVGALGLGGEALFPVGGRARRTIALARPGAVRQASTTPSARPDLAEQLTGIAAVLDAAADRAEARAASKPSMERPAFGEETQALLDRLERLADMRDRGLLDAAEYETAKDAVMRELEARR